MVPFSFCKMVPVVGVALVIEVVKQLLLNAGVIVKLLVRVWPSTLIVTL